MARALIVFMPMILGSCMEPLSLPLPPNGEVITYESSPGPFTCGSPSCAHHKIVVASDGRLAIEASRWDRATEGLRSSRWTARLSPGQVAPFWKRLAPYRPAKELLLDDGLSCRDFASDSGEVRITWQSAAATSRLVYNFGCEAAERREMAKALHTAPSLIPLRYLRTAFAY